MQFNKLALAAAVAAAPATGMAMEPMNDKSMSNVTGQDGISIDLSTQLNAELRVHDTDGFTDPSGNARTDSGAIVIGNFGLSSGTSLHSVIFPASPARDSCIRMSSSLSLSISSRMMRTTS